MTPQRTEACATLRARLEGVVSDIERQKEILRELEQSRRDIHRQLNDLSDPIARPPVEISSEIFIHCSPCVDEAYNRLCKLLLLSICTMWTEIALSIPHLWTDLRVKMPQWRLNSRTCSTDGFRTAKKNHSSSRSPDPPLRAQGIHILAAQAPHLRELELPSPLYLPPLSLTEAFQSLESLRVKRGNCIDSASLVLNVVQVMQSAPRLTLGADPASRRLPEIEYCVRHARLKRTRSDSSHILRLLTLP
jgi:hypothetical protein